MSERSERAGVGFNEEQRVMLGVLRATGCPDPEAVVSGARMDATVLGAAMVPTLRDLAAATAALIDAFLRATAPAPPPTDGGTTEAAPDHAGRDVTRADLVPTQRGEMGRG